jgi:superfamily II DNA or RNA helicase
MTYHINTGIQATSMPLQLIIAANAVVAKIQNADDAVKNLITEKLSYLVEGHEFMHAFTTGGWNGRSSFFARRTSTFPAGFVHLVHSELMRAGYGVRIVKKQAPAPLGPENPIVDSFGNDNPNYDFQPRALRQTEKHHRGIIQVATGGGKSKIAKLIIARYRRMTMFITTRGVLMYQMKDQLVSDCGFNVGVIGDGTWAPTRGVNVGMVQSLVSQLAEPDMNEEIRQVVKKNAKSSLPMTRAQCMAEAKVRFDEKILVRRRTIKLLEMVEVVIGEEAHEAGGNSYYEILKWCKNAHIRIALTATPFMRADAEDNMRLMAAFGPKLIIVSEKLLIDRGILAKPYFLYKSPPAHPKLRKSSPYQRAVTFGVIEATFRNSCIVHYCKKAKEYGLSVLPLVQRKEHGLILCKLLREAGLAAQFIQGENNQGERTRALNAIGSGRLDVLIGTTILDVGVDVPSIGMVILAGGGKAEVALRQRVGRGMRAKKIGPNVIFVLDFADELNSHLRGHARERRAIIEATPGFAENILPPGADFPWELFSERKAA